MDFKDGQVVVAGTDFKMLRGIAVTAATMPTPDGEKLLVVIRLELVVGPNQPAEIVQVSVPAEKFHKLAELFQLRSAQLSAHTTPKGQVQ